MSFLEIYTEIFLDEACQDLLQQRGKANMATPRELLNMSEGYMGICYTILSTRVYLKFS